MNDMTDFDDKISSVIINCWLPEDFSEWGDAENAETSSKEERALRMVAAVGEHYKPWTKRKTCFDIVVRFCSLN
jgi:hypothetical protein